MTIPLITKELQAELRTAVRAQFAWGDKYKDHLLLTDRQKLAILATALHEIWMCAIEEDKMSIYVGKALSRTGLDSLQAVIDLNGDKDE